LLEALFHKALRLCEETFRYGRLKH
jgi:hypothetical protein